MNSTFFLKNFVSIFLVEINRMHLIEIFRILVSKLFYFTKTYFFF